MIVYLCTNLINGKQYVGITSISLGKRKSNHKSLALRCGSQTKFHRALRKYSIENFKWEVLDECSESIDILIEKEIKYISKFDTYKNGYNMTIGGDGAVGSIHTEEWKQQQSKRVKKFHKENKEHQKWLRMSLDEKYGKDSAAIRNKMSITRKGKLINGKRIDLTENGRISLSLSKLKEGNPNYVKIDDDTQKIIIFLYKKYGKIVPEILNESGYSKHVIKRFLKDIKIYAGRKKYKNGDSNAKI
jgi:group I intron endonuclease